MMACLRHGIRQHSMLTWFSIFYYFWVEIIIYKLYVLGNVSETFGNKVCQDGFKANRKKTTSEKVFFQLKRS